MFKNLPVFLAALLCFTASFCVAQNKQRQIDSLLQVNAAFPKDDSAKVQRLMIVSELSLSIADPETGLRYAQQALAVAEKMKSRLMMARAYVRIGNALNLQHKVPEAIAYREKALAIFIEHKLGEKIANTLYSLGNDYLRQDQSYKALDYYLKAYEAIKPLHVPMGEFSCLAQIANVYLTLGNHKKALDYQFNALKVAEEMKDKSFISVAYTGIGNSYNGLGVFDKAIEYFKKSLVLKEAVDEKRSQCIVLLNMASTYISLKNYPEALANYEKSLKISTALANKEAEASAYNGIGHIMALQNKKTEALASYKKGLQLNEEINDERSVAESLVYLASSYTESGELSLAEAPLNRASAIYKRIESLEGQRNVYQGYSDYYEAKKDFQRAFDNYKSYIIIRDSIANNDLRNQYTRREMQYDFDKKESTYLLNAQLTDQKLARQQILAIQQQQVLLLEKQKLSLSDKEKSLQRLMFLKKQADLENDRKLQASKFQQAKILASYEASLRDKQISKQDQQIRFDFRVKIFLGVAIALALLSAMLIFLNNRRTARLNTIINAQKSELEQLNKVKDRIFSVVSHDMRTPVNSLMSFIQLLENGTIEQEKLKRYSAVLKNNLNYTSTMMENLLNWAASQMQGFNPRLESLQVHGLVQGVVASLETTASQKKLTITNMVPAAATCIADATMLTLVINNLINNSIKFTPKGGTIVIEASQLSESLQLRVRDSGRGLTPEQLEHFNKPGNLGAGKSTPGTDQEKGTGLGLLLCKTFVGMMNGSIYAEKAEKGSAFVMELMAGDE